MLLTNQICIQGVSKSFIFVHVNRIFAYRHTPIICYGDIVPMFSWLTSHHVF